MYTYTYIYNIYIMYIYICIKLYAPMAPFYGWGSTASTLHSYYEEIVYFLPLSFQKFLVLIRSISGG